MPAVPAVCGYCGTIFTTGAILGPGVSGINFIDSVSPCPKCGKLGQIPDGTYSAIGNALEILVGVGDAEASVAALTRMRNAIQANPSADPAEVFSEMGQEASEALAKAAPSDPEQQRVWMAAVISALAFAWEKFPDGALKWIELAEKAQELLGFSGH